MLSSPKEYQFQLKAHTKAEAIRMWRTAIKEQWNHNCAYCGEYGDTIDHIHPQARGGTDELTNVLCCCKRCNKEKAHEEVEIWYFQQYFFNQDRWDRIEEWRRIKTEGKKKRYIRGRAGQPTRSVIL